MAKGHFSNYVVVEGDYSGLPFAPAHSVL